MHCKAHRICFFDVSINCNDCARIKIFDLAAGIVANLSTVCDSRFEHEVHTVVARSDVQLLTIDIIALYSNILV